MAPAMRTGQYHTILQIVPLHAEMIDVEQSPVKQALLDKQLGSRYH
jgi:hypothetical protein